VIWLWLGLASLLFMPVVTTLFLTGLHYYLRWRYLGYVLRIFQEKPLFIIPRGQPVPNAEDVSFPTTNGLTLHGSYLKTPAPQRRGVVLFGLEFGSNRWSCVPYCQHLLDAGYDIFTFEPRGQGDSSIQPNYEPLQWVTDYEVEDARAALAYLKSRSDRDPRGVGCFGISKGGGAVVLAAADDPFVRCFVTDGIFATYSTVIPYMRKWYGIYNSHYTLQGLFPLWYYGLVGTVALRKLAQLRNCRFPALEKAIERIAPRPLLMIHGGGDTYIKPDIAEHLFSLARGTKELWMVDGAKHNQALQLVPEEYRRRVLEFFNRHLGEEPTQLLASSVPAPAATLAKTL
jgi:pimeloyl-ACP methyl ester carboxylesterase